jgi:hypothetical protein
MFINKQKPNISWISTQKYDGDEWVTYTKHFVAIKVVRSAVIRFESDCVCAVWVNGQFIISGTGRMPERVNAHEVTSRLTVGENTICLKLGTHYFQTRGHEVMAERGFWLNSAAFELCIEYQDGEKQIIATDKTWEAFADGRPQKILETALVTEAEYGMMWANAAIWPEPRLHRKPIPNAVAQVAGQAYVEYANADQAEYAQPEGVAKTNMLMENGMLIPDPQCTQQPYVIYDFGRIIVGFTELFCQTDTDAQVCFTHDSGENIADFDKEAENRRIGMLKVRLPIKAGEKSVFNLRRRAFRYLKVELNGQVSIDSIRVKLCMFPQVDTGYFRCNDQMLNTAWEVGKYTLQINKQQEYESCPKYEMQFFAGDGAIDAWIDYYAFGNADLLNASLSVKHDERSTGIAQSPTWNRSIIQWDYFAWRIICIYIHYKHTGDLAFLKRYYNEAHTNLLWQLERLNRKGLMFQRPCQVSSFNYNLGQTEWTCSTARIGEKTALNALLYKSLCVMAELAQAVGQDENAAKWTEAAKELREAINTHLWSEEKQAYIDSLDDFISQDGNTFAVLFDVADDARKKIVLKTMKDKLWSPYGAAILDQYVPHTRGGIRCISPFMSALEAMARFENNQPEEALDLIRRCWGTMLKKGAKTFWEFAPNNDTGKWGTPSHAWSAGCTYLLSAYIMGIRPAEPDYETVLFAPRPCDLTEFYGVVPTSKGFVAASALRNENGNFCFTLTVPQNMKVVCDLPENSTVEIVKY